MILSLLILTITQLQYLNTVLYLPLYTYITTYGLSIRVLQKYSAKLALKALG